MVLDLRDNPGGYLGSIFMCNEFLEKGELNCIYQREV